MKEASFFCHYYDVILTRSHSRIQPCTHRMDQSSVALAGDVASGSSVCGSDGRRRLERIAVSVRCRESALCVGSVLSVNNLGVRLVRLARVESAGAGAAAGSGAGVAAAASSTATSTFARSIFVIVGAVVVVGDEGPSAAGAIDDVYVESSAGSGQRQQRKKFFLGGEVSASCFCAAARAFCAAAPPGVSEARGIMNMATVHC